MAVFKQFQIECLKHEIEQKFGRTYKSPSDFATLEKSIRQTTGERLSESTLRRIWGYTRNDGNPRLATLTVLARVLGFIDWDEYVVSLMRRQLIESGFITSDIVRVESLCPDDTVKFGWCPDRTITLRYLGDSRFEVVEQSNSKLAVGDTFRTLILRNGVPLYCTELIHLGLPADNYVAGSQNGISDLEYLPRRKDSHDDSDTNTPN